MENSKVIRFVVMMTVLVAVVLAGMRELTKEVAAKNEAVFNKRAILSSIAAEVDYNPGDLTNEEVLSVFDNQVEQKVLNMEGEEVSDIKAENVDMAREEKKPVEERLLPLYIYNKKGGEKYYILSIRGNGLWDKIWGNIALKEDAVTVAGVAFDHQGETPGLGAEIKDNPAFSEQFQGKRIYDYNGEYTAVLVRKGGAKNPEYEVDGISGATITADGVSEMINRGIKYYEPYLQPIRTAKKETKG